MLYTVLQIQVLLKIYYKLLSDKLKVKLQNAMYFQDCFLKSTFRYTILSIGLIMDLKLKMHHL